MLGAGDRAAAADRAGCVLGVVYGGGKMLITCDCTDPACDVAGCKKFGDRAQLDGDAKLAPNSDALRLGINLEWHPERYCEDAAAELRRLHTEIERLRGLCKWASGQLFEAGQTEAADTVLEKLEGDSLSPPLEQAQPVQEPAGWTWADDFREWLVQSAKLPEPLKLNDILSMFDACRPGVNRLSAPKPEASPWQGGLTNEELRRGWAQRLPGVEPTDRELSAFAVGIEAGYKIVWVDDPLVIALRNKLKQFRKAAKNLIEAVEDGNSLWWVAAEDLKKLLGESDE